jgi:hypothetical protein
MNMVEFLLFCIATVGMTSIIVQGAIFMPFRQYIENLAETGRQRRAQAAQEPHRILQKPLVEWLHELINCAQCTGFWCGLFCGLFLLSPDSNWIAETNVWQILNRLIVWLCCGFGGSFLAPLGCNIIDWIFYRKMNALRQLEEQDMILAERQAALSDAQE